MKSPDHLGMPLSAALQHSEPLGNLLQRVQASQQGLKRVARLLPGGLKTGVRAGPLDDEGWTLLVDNAAMAAKLRQLLPALEQELRSSGWGQHPLKIKVLPRTPAGG